MRPKVLSRRTSATSIAGNGVAIITLIAFVTLIITLVSNTNVALVDDDVAIDKTTRPVSSTTTSTTENNDDEDVADDASAADYDDGIVFSITRSKSNTTPPRPLPVVPVEKVPVARGENSDAVATDDHNGFYDNINTNNKRHDFNGFTSKTVATDNTKSTAEAFFEGVELQESMLVTAHKQLLPHRNKRYLVFPSGSSFQMIFDLIIGIVDYTSFAILGITCAVAWELPSKPPGEIIDDVQQRLNEGTLGLSRRNDSTQQQLQYVDVAAPADVAVATENDYKAQMSATVVDRKPMQSDAFYNKNNNYNNRNSDRNHYNYGFEPRQPQQQQTSYYAFDGSDKSNSKTFPATQQQQYGGNHPEVGFATHSNKHSNYYNNNNNVRNHNGVSSTSGYASRDKNQFVDWNRKGPLWQQEQHYKQAPQKYKYPPMTQDFGQDNWWQRNRERLESGWQQKQQQWAKYDQRPTQQTSAQLPPITNYAQPSIGSARGGRARKILQTPPKHRIYTVFGKRRRRRDMDDFELKMEQVHRREHLQSRQKLYGKIENLYKVRGHNGTECVMRALCETSAHSARNREPQSFISELLRVIFTMPQDVAQQQRDDESLNDEQDAVARQSVAAHFWDAHALATDCAERYALCEHSIWSDLDYGMKL